MSYNGYRPIHNFYDYLCRAYRIGPLGRAILEHMQARTDESGNATAWTSSGEIARAINSTTARVRDEQRRLMKKGLLIFTGRTNATHRYFLPAKLLAGGAKPGFFLTRLWPHAVDLATTAEIVTGKNMSADLAEIILRPETSWRTDETLTRILSIHIRDGKVTLDAILTPGDSAPIRAATKSGKSAKKPAGITDEQQAKNLAELANIGRKLEGPTWENFGPIN